MANTDIIRRLREACDRWSAGELDAAGFQLAISGHGSALEGYGQRTGREAEVFADRVSKAWFGPDPVHSDPPQSRAAVDAVVRDIHRWLDTLEADA